MHLTKKQDITGVILVGGKSSRMGKDKAFLEVEGKPLFERVLELFSENFELVTLVGDRPERFTAYGLPVISDIYPGSALGGIYTGLYHSPTDYVFVSSCDIPFPNGEVLSYLCALRDGYDVIVPTTANGYEPLFALYSKRCLEPMKTLLESGDFCAYAYFHRVRTRCIPYEELAHLDRGGDAFLNINTPDEFAKIGG